MNPHAAPATPEAASADTALIESVIRADLIAALGTVLDADAARQPAGYRNTALADLAAEINARLAEHFDQDTLYVQHALALAEEAGEFTGAFRRWAGLARRTGTWADMVAELADVVITAYVTADVLGIDLAAAITAKAGIILTRGWRDPRPASTDAGCLGCPGAPHCTGLGGTGCLIPDGGWACRQCGAAFFGAPPEDDRCEDCTDAGTSR
jgi:NTP pyrophosphatase (non-canonical NTP hydrolase)